MVSSSPDVSNSFVFLYSNSSVSQSGWWCPALHLSPLVAIHLSASLAGGVGLSTCLQFICLPLSNSFVSQSGWWCPALLLSPIHLSPHITIHLSPRLAGGVRLSGCLQFICLPLKQFICLPVWVRLSGCLQFICLPIKRFICLPVWLVASGSPDVSN